MIEQVVAVWSTSLYRITLDIIGLFVILFCAIWIVIGAFRVLRHRNARDMGFGVLLAGVSLAGVALFVYLSASTTARRAFIDIPMRELAGAFATSAVAFTLAVIAVVLVSLLVARLSKGSEIRAGVATISILGGDHPRHKRHFLYATTHQPNIDQVWVDPVSRHSNKSRKRSPHQHFRRQNHRRPDSDDAGTRQRAVCGRHQGPDMDHEG